MYVHPAFAKANALMPEYSPDFSGEFSFLEHSLTPKIWVVERAIGRCSKRCARQAIYSGSSRYRRVRISGFGEPRRGTWQESSGAVYCPGTRCRPSERTTTAYDLRAYLDRKYT
jgi:hypothetical protein